MNSFTCCGVNAEIVNPVAHPQGVAPEEQVQGVGIMCHVCNRKATGKDFDDAIKNYGEPTKAAVKSKSVQKRENIQRGKPMYENMNNGPQNQMVRYTPGQLASDIRGMDLSTIISPVISGNQSAMDRLIENNIDRYPLSLKGASWDKIWSTPEGQASIKHEIEEALMLGAYLGKTGDLVPFGKVCQFIASVEAYEFALTYGNNAPFEDITIELIYTDDEWRTGSKNGEFFIENIHGKDRKKVSHVAVYGVLNQTGKTVGEMYDASRLLEKAEAHSTPYKNYMILMRAYEYAKSEGKVNKDRNGRESFIYYEEAGPKDGDKYFQKSVDNFRAQEAAGKLQVDSKGEYSVETLPKKDGGTWTKKTYRYEIEGGAVERTIFPDELSNPYAGADQPEMLRKTAGKTFLRKYEKTRNSAAAMSEIKSSKSAVERTLNMAEESIPGEYETN